MRTPLALVALVSLLAAHADEGRAPGEKLSTTSHTVQQVQGAARRSTLVGTAVVDLTGIVTAVSSNSFVVQAAPDGDAATSDAILVHVGRGFTGLPALGDDVAVSGKVVEWAGRQNAEVGPGSLTQTQLAPPVTVRVLASGVALPEPVSVGASGRMPPVRAVTAADIEEKSWDPNASPLDFWESLEFMRVRLSDAVVCGPTSQGSFYAVPERGAGYPITKRGGVTLAGETGQPCPGLIVIDNAPGAQLPIATVGDRAASITGLLVPDATRPALLVASAIEGWEKAELPRTPTRLVSDAEHLTIATFNVENFSGARPARADELARSLVKYLQSPAIVGLQEVQDDDGPGREGTRGHSDVVSAASTYAVLVSAIAAAGGPRYRWTDVPPVAHQEGGEPGGNIRVGFLWDPERVSFEPRGQAGSMSANRVEKGEDGKARLALNPGRVEPQDPSFAETRRTLAGEFGFRGHRVVILDSHFSSRREDEPAYGAHQPPVLRSEVKRLGQAKAVQRFIAELAGAQDPDLTILHLGDCNDFHFRPALKVLAGEALEILTFRLPPEERYSYVFQGSSQPLDHALLGGPLKGKAEGVELEYVHINAEYPEGRRVSDHDPLVVRLHLP